MKISLKFYVILLFVLSYSIVIAQTKNEEAAFVDSLLSEMTLSEKIGQLVELVGVSSVNDEILRNGMVSSILGIKDAEAANKLQKPLSKSLDSVFRYYLQTTLYTDTILPSRFRWQKLQVGIPI